MTSSGQPNILFILTDQQRADALGAVSEWMRTPAMDRLAADGVRFARCVAQSPGCIPSRTSLMTGLYPHNHGVWQAQGFTLPATARTWLKKVRVAGYRTSVIGKTHLHPHYGDLRERRSLVEAWGFEDVVEIAGPRASGGAASDMTDEWEREGLWEAFREDLRARQGADRFLVRPSPLGLEHHYDSFVGRRAVSQIASYGTDRPWFLWVGFGGPHEPWDAPEPYFSQHNPADLPPPLPQIESVAEERPRGALLDDRIAEDAERLAPVGREGLAALRANYAAKVSMIDHWVGQILAAVEDRSELERTLVVFASDHGEMNGDHGLIHKSCFLEGAVTVPLIVRLPGGEAGGQIATEPVELNDLGPTFAEAAGSELDYRQWGRSLWPVLRGEASSVRDLVVSEQRGEVMASTSDWKIAVNEAQEAYLCTNVGEDPGESKNLAGTPGATEAEQAMHDRLQRFLVETQLEDEWY